MRTKGLVGCIPERPPRSFRATRRTALYAIAALAGTVLPRGLVLAQAAEPAGDDWLPDVLGLFLPVRGAARIGRLYLEASEGSKSRETLLEELGLTPASALRADRLASVRERLHADFVAGELVTIDGWVLARSEAAACALLELSRRNRS